MGYLRSVPDDERDPMDDPEMVDNEDELDAQMNAQLNAEAAPYSNTNPFRLHNGWDDLETETKPDFDKVLHELRRIRRAIRREAPRHTTKFDAFDIASDVRDWKIGDWRVFTKADVLELETSLDRARLRYLEQAHSTKERLLREVMERYGKVISRVETRVRKERRAARESASESDASNDDDDGLGDPFDVEDRAPCDQKKPVGRRARNPAGDVRRAARKPNVKIPDPEDEVNLSKPHRRARAGPSEPVPDADLEDLDDLDLDDLDPDDPESVGMDPVDAESGDVDPTDPVDPVP